MLLQNITLPYVCHQTLHPLCEGAGTRLVYYRHGRILADFLMLETQQTIILIMAQHDISSGVNMYAAYAYN